MKTILGVDTGGTFTDFVCLKNDALRVHKVLSTPDAPQRAILQGIREMGLETAMISGDLYIIHGTTVATNAALEAKGVHTVYVGNKGLTDILTIGRQTRAELYNLTPKPIPSPFQEALGVSARLTATGEELTGFSAGELDALKKAVDQINPEAIAINLLFSFMNPEHELAIEALFKDDYFVSRSSHVLPEYREYERGIATWLNAWLGPLIKAYMEDLQAQVSPCSLAIMQSSGVTIGAKQAATRAVNLLLSGPAGGLNAAEYLGLQTGITRLMTFDMGGTSSDVSLLDGRIQLTNEGRIGPFPIAVPMADIHTIGAGGGSLAYMDEGGLLKVGPASAGADPGPACYGRGGQQVTVTDANLILGRLPEDSRLAGNLPLNISAARAAMKTLASELGTSVEDTARGIISLANEHMAQALRVISVQKGHDPREFTLACFGGAGGLHLCALAEALEMTRAIVPINAGVLSALGMLVTTPGRELVQTHRAVLDDLGIPELFELFETMVSATLPELLAEGISTPTVHRRLDLRYVGQSYTLTLDLTESIEQLVEQFHQNHQQQYGHRMERPVEMVNLRAQVTARQEPLELPKWQVNEPLDEREVRLPGHASPVKQLNRSGLAIGAQILGPALITEQHATTFLAEHWQAEVDEIGNLILTRLHSKRNE